MCLQSTSHQLLNSQNFRLTATGAGCTFLFTPSWVRTVQSQGRKVTTEELEALLEGAEESDSLEFKGAMAWDHQGLAKDFMAMANIEFGGRIVFGIEDATLARQGMTADQIATFDFDIMKDQIGKLADPYIQFSKEIVTDGEGRKFVVVTVAPFEDGLVICRNNGTEVRAGAIYYRSRTRRPQSAPISNSTEMRDLIDIAVVRRARRNARIGYTVAVDPGYDFDAELGGL